jgi:hypothetical protein
MKERASREGEEDNEREREMARGREEREATDRKRQ